MCSSLNIAHPVTHISKHLIISAMSSQSILLSNAFNIDSSCSLKLDVKEYDPLATLYNTYNITDLIARVYRGSFFVAAMVIANRHKTITIGATINIMIILLKVVPYFVHMFPCSTIPSSVFKCVVYCAGLSW